MSDEQWKPVVGFEDSYEVSNHGRVKSHAILRSGKRANRFINGYYNSKGYCRVELRSGGKRVQIFMHRLVMAAFIGPCPDGKNINHKDGNPSNNNLDNLEYVTPQENVIHAFRVLGHKNNGNHVRGEKNPMVILTEQQVMEIKQHLTDQIFTIPEIASLYNVERSAINHIRHNNTWVHVPWPNGELSKDRYRGKNERPWNKKISE